jgi:hypothetical protein
MAGKTSSAPTTAELATVPSQYQSLVTAASAKYGVPFSLLSAQINQESGWQPSVVSSAGAEGIAQFMPATAASNNVNPMDPSSAIPGMASLMASYFKEFGSWADALAAYNAGPGAVEKYDGVPPYSQTRSYVSDILSASGTPNTLGTSKGGTSGSGGSGGTSSTAPPSSGASSGLLAKVGAFLLGGALLLVGIFVLVSGNKGVQSTAKVAAVAA